MMPYPEFPGYYVTKDGTIFTDKGGGVGLKQKVQRVVKDGYLRVSLKHEGKTYHRFVHRMVALTYLGPSSLTVNHKDYNKANNTLNNLEYLTARENSTHAWEGKRHVHGDANRATRIKDSDVEYLMSLKGKLPVKEVAGMFGVSRQCIWRYWSHFGRWGQENYRKNRSREVKNAK